MNAPKCTVPLSAIFILCIGFCYAENPIYFDFSGTVAIQRITSYGSRGFYTAGTDNTTFTVDRAVFLTQIDFPRLYTFSNGELVRLNDAVEAVVRLINRETGELFSGVVELPARPKGPTAVKILPAAKLEPNHVYDIEVTLPLGNVYGFYGRHEGDTFEARSHLIPRPVTMNFQASNTAIETIDDTKHQPSIGMVLTLHLSRTSVLDALFPDENTLVGSIVPNVLYRLFNP